MNRESLLFCVGALALTVVVLAAGFGLAALPPETVAAARRPVAAETLPDVELGGGFGTVTVIDLLGFYLEHPPAPAGAAGAAPAATKRFGGC